MDRRRQRHQPPKSLSLSVSLTSLSTNYQDILTSRKCPMNGYCECFLTNPITIATSFSPRPERVSGHSSFSILCYASHKATRPHMQTICPERIECLAFFFFFSQHLLIAPTYMYLPTTYTSLRPPTHTPCLPCGLRTLHIRPCAEKKKKKKKKKERSPKSAALKVKDVPSFIMSTRPNHVLAAALQITTNH